MWQPFENIRACFMGIEQNVLQIHSLQLSEIFTLKQVHGSKVIYLENESNASAFKESPGDAILSSIPNLPIAIKTADCVPILLAHPSGIIGAVHAGWRGTASEILTRTLEWIPKLFQIGLEQFKIIIGPAINQECYEVGDEVAKQFKKYSNAIIPQKEKYLLDLKEINRQQALASGLSAQQIEIDPRCTYCSADYHSYRRAQKLGEKKAGRNYSWIITSHQQ